MLITYLPRSLRPYLYDILLLGPDRPSFLHFAERKKNGSDVINPRVSGTATEGPKLGQCSETPSMGKFSTLLLLLIAVLASYSYIASMASVNAWILS